MRTLALITLTGVLAVGCGDDRHYAGLLLRSHVTKGSAVLAGATVKLTPVANDGVHSNGKESAPFELTDTVIQPCTKDDLEKCPRGSATTDAEGLGSLLLQPPAPRKDYERDEEHPEREHHPGRFARSLRLTITDGAQVTEHSFTFAREEPHWIFRRDGVAAPAVADTHVCTYDSDYEQCVLDLNLSVP